MADVPNFPLLFERIANYLANSKWSATHEKRLSEMGIPAESVNAFKSFMIGHQDDHGLIEAQEAIETLHRTIYFGCSSYPCLGTRPNIKPVG